MSGLRRRVDMPWISAKCTASPGRVRYELRTEQTQVAKGVPHPARARG
jgi:hypothetical protein